MFHNNCNSCCSLIFILHDFHSCFRPCCSARTVSLAGSLSCLDQGTYNYGTVMRKVFNSIYLTLSVLQSTGPAVLVVLHDPGLLQTGLPRTGLLRNFHHGTDRGRDRLVAGGGASPPVEDQHTPRRGRGVASRHPQRLQYVIHVSLSDKLLIILCVRTCRRHASAGNSSGLHSHAALRTHAHPGGDHCSG